MENITAFSLPSNITDVQYEFSSFNSTNPPTLTGLSVFTICIYVLAFLLGTIGNGLVIWIAGFRMKTTVNVVWFLNLAIADFIFTVFLPLSIAYIALGFHWPFGNFMCKLNSAMAFLNLFASIFTLMVISVDRCISVVFPVWAQNHRSPRLAFVVSLVIWMFALTFSITYFIFRDTEEDEFGYVYCFNNFNDEYDDLFILRHRATVATRFIFGFFIPFTVITACYVVIALKLHINHMATTTKPFKVIVAVLVCFFVCWLPYHVFSFLELYVDPENDFLRIGIPLASSLAFLNSCVNPFLYVFIGRDFKDKFLTSIQSVFERAFSEDNTQSDLKSKTKSTSDSQLV
ncbi:chemerin-like receptor 1 [Pelodytes ibericus]